MTIPMLAGYREAVDAGVSLHWLKPREKVPAALAWQSKPTKSWDDLVESYSAEQNIGLRTGIKSKTDAGYIHIIDLDIRVEAKAAEAHGKLASIAPGYEKLPTVISGSGGESRHYYFVAPEPLKMSKVKSDGFSMVWDDNLGREVKKHDWEIDLLSTGRQAVIPPSIHPSTGKPYRWLIEFPWDELNLGIGPTVTINTAEVSVPLAEVGDDLLSMVLSSPLQIEAAEIKGYLDDLPDDWVEDRETWLTCGEALHHQYRGSEEGFRLWCNWSKQSDKFDLKDSKRVWRSFKPDARNPITFKTVIAAAQESRGEKQYDSLVNVSDDLPAEIEDNPIDRIDDDEDWFSKLDKTDEGVVKPTMPNLVLILKHDVRLRGVIGFNRFTNSISVRNTPRVLLPKKEGRSSTNLSDSCWSVSDTINGTPWHDNHTTDIRFLLERKRTLEGWGLKVADRDLLAAISKVAQSNPYHPVIDLLESLPEWDGKHRADRLWIDYLGAKDDPYHRKTAMLFLIGAIARVFEPGCKFDNAPILEGVQGARKSTFIEVISMGFYGELGSDLTDPKLLVEQTDGKWILEIPELQGFNRHDIRELKGVMSRKSEQVRRPYARFSEEVKRQYVMIGSTNDSEYLRDPTGGRRFWPIACNKTKREPIDIDELKKNLNQIWAEALAMYKELRSRHSYGDLPLYLDDDEALRISEELQASRTLETVEQSLAGEIEKLLSEPLGSEFDDLDETEPHYREMVCGKEIWIDVLGRPETSFNRQAQLEVSEAMKFVQGWTKRDGTVNHPRYGKQRIYVRV